MRRPGVGMCMPEGCVPAAWTFVQQPHGPSCSSRIARRERVWSPLPPSIAHRVDLAQDLALAHAARDAVEALVQQVQQVALGGKLLCGARHDAARGA